MFSKIWSPSLESAWKPWLWSFLPLSQTSTIREDWWDVWEFKVLVSDEEWEFSGSSPWFWLWGPLPTSQAYSIWCLLSTQPSAHAPSAVGGICSGWCWWKETQAFPVKWVMRIPNTIWAELQSFRVFLKWMSYIPKNMKIYNIFKKEIGLPTRAHTVPHLAEYFILSCFER